MTGTVDAGVATIVIIVLLKRGTRALMGGGNVRIRTVIARRSHVTLHGMRTFMHIIDRDEQHDQ